MEKKSKEGTNAAIIGIIIVALCCFAPLLIITLGAVGVSVFTPYLQYALYAAIILLIVVAIISYKKWKKQSK
jgi:mercuric ion transport protein